MKILELGAGPPVTGGIPTFLALIEEYAGRDSVLMVDFINGAPPVDAGPSRRLYTSLRVSCTLFLSLFKRYDVVHIQVSGVKSFLEKSWYNVICKVMRTPTVMQFHNSTIPISYEVAPRLRKRILAWLLRQPDSVVILYPGLRPFFEHTAGCTHVNVIPNGVVAPSCVPRRSTEKQQLKVLYLGHIVEAKGLYVLLDAISLMPDNGRRFEFHLLGCGQHEDDFKRVKYAFESRGLDHVHFHGYQSGGDKEAFLLVSDIFILPSLAEAFPFAVLEAMSYALPVAVTKVGAIPDFVEDGVNGYVIEPNNAEQLATSLTRLAEDPEARLRMGENNYRKVCESYSFSDTLMKLKVVFADAANRGRTDQMYDT